MPTKRDLVEAHGFSRRRLVTAFVSGAPGGREVEPHRPGRVLVGGAALTVLLLAGAAVSGVLAGRPGDDWLDVGLVVSEDDGTPYVITRGEDPVLRPVVNTTSARLVLGADLEPTTVPQEDIDAQAVGDDLGILGAPTSLPAPGLLVDGGWTACTAAGAGVRVRVAEEPGAVALPDAAMVLRVRGTGELVLVAPAGDRLGEPRASRYALPSRPAERDRFLRALDLPESAAAVEVDADFVDLFPEASALTASAFGLRDVGAPVVYGGDDFAGLVVGDVVTSAGDTFLLTDVGPTTLDPFAAALALATAGGTPARVVASVGATVGRGHPDDWPDGALAPAGRDVCALLVTRADRAATVLVAAPVDAAAAADAVDAVDAGDPAGGVAPGERTVDVQPGRGAFVLGGGRERGDPRPFVIGARGVRHALVGPEAVENLGYADHPARVVPDPWLELFPCGVDLSREAALRPPSTTTEACA